MKRTTPIARAIAIILAGFSIEAGALTSGKGLSSEPSPHPHANLNSSLAMAEAPQPPLRPYSALAVDTAKNPLAQQPAQVTQAEGFRPSSAGATPTPQVIYLFTLGFGLTILGYQLKRLFA